jgi:hypothetical protein
MLLRPGGIAVITARPWRHHGELTDFPGRPGRGRRRRRPRRPGRPAGPAASPPDPAGGTDAIAGITTPVLFWLPGPRRLMPSAWDRTRTALDQAYLEAMAAGPA